jgi:membrane protease YdiL (CAAX protease family)
MNKTNERLYLEYALALSAAVIICTGWRLAFGSGKDWLWMLGDAQAFMVLVLIYPIVEELSFRGVIQGVLLHGTHHREMLPGVTVANGVTSLLFMAIHFVHHPPLWAAAVAIPSMIFGYFRDRLGSVMPAIFLHGFYNLIFYSMMGK